MRALLWLLILAALAVALAVVANSSDGYVLLVQPPWRIELSVNLLILLALLAFTLGYFLLRAILHTLNLPGAVRQFRERRRRAKGEAALCAAVRYQFEGRYGQALKSAALAHDTGHAPGLAAVLAMRSAHALRDEERQQTWRNRALVWDEEFRAARLMSEAEIALDERRFDTAAELLEALSVTTGRHIAALRLLLRARQGMGDWNEVLQLIRLLEKHRALTVEQASSLKLRTNREWLRALPQEAPALMRHWHALPRGERRHPLLAQDMARALIAAGNCGEAQSVIEEAIEEQWDSSLAALFADCAVGDSLGRIALAEKWLHDHPRDAQLLLTLGRLCRYQQLWGKAQSYLEASLSLQPTRAAHHELAQLFDLLDRAGEANRHYRAAAALP
jgi:HemY protein